MDAKEQIDKQTQEAKGSIIIAVANNGDYAVRVEGKLTSHEVNGILLSVAKQIKQELGL